MEESRVEQAVKLHEQGYSCAQAVVSAYCDLVGLEEGTAIRIAEGFGLGMGSMEVCGALTGAYMLAGLKVSAGKGGQGNTKTETYKLIRQMGERFREMNQTYICREIKGVGTGEILRSCNGCVEDAAQIVEEFLF